MTERKTIRQLRQEWGWTQEQVARRVGVAQGTVSQGEHGNRRPYRRNLQRLAAFFGISIEDIALGPAEPAFQETSQHGMGEALVPAVLVALAIFISVGVGILLWRWRQNGGNQDDHS